MGKFIMTLLAAAICILVGCGQEPRQRKEWNTELEGVFAIESDNYVENDSCKGYAYLEYDTLLFNRMSLSIPIDTNKIQVPEFSGYSYLGDFDMYINHEKFNAFCSYGYRFAPPFFTSYLFIYEGGLHDTMKIPTGDINVEIKTNNTVIYTFDFYPIPLTSAP